MRITLDATPLLGPRTGIGQYAAHLVDALPAALARAGLRDAELQVSTWTLRGGRVADLPPGVRQVGHRIPARALRAAWLRGAWPSAEALSGRATVFHGLNFVSPPTRGAAEVVTIHDLTYEEHADTVNRADLSYRRLVRRALDRGAHAITPSEVVADRVRQFYGLDLDRVTATPLGVDPTWFDAGIPTADWLAARGIPEDYVVFVGSLGPRKNLRRLVEAYEKLGAGSGGTALVLAGPAGRATELSGRPGVILTGWLSDEDLRRLVTGARALALPSLDEGFGLPVVEALAAGRPVLASDIPIMHEVAGPYGVLVAPHDVDALVDGLRSVLLVSDDDDSRRARRAWASRFSWDATADRTVAVYRAVAR